MCYIKCAIESLKWMKSSVAITNLAMNRSAINSVDVIKKLIPHVFDRKYLASLVQTSLVFVNRMYALDVLYCSLTIFYTKTFCFSHTSRYFCWELMWVSNIWKVNMPVSVSNPWIHLFCHMIIHSNCQLRPDLPTLNTSDVFNHHLPRWEVTLPEIKRK